MSHTYSCFYVHLVWSTKKRIHYIVPPFKNLLYEYIDKLIPKHGGHVLAIGGMPDHIHIFLSLKPTATVSDFVSKIKANSSKFMRQLNIELSSFHWQEGYGMFVVSASLKNVVKKYVLNQEENHKRKSFEEEYVGLLEKHEIAHQKENLFD